MSQRQNAGLDSKVLGQNGKLAIDVRILIVLNYKIDLYCNYTETDVVLKALTVFKGMCFHHQLHLVI